MGHQMRVELSSNGISNELANPYTTRGTHWIIKLCLVWHTGLRLLTEPTKWSHLNTELARSLMF